MLQSSRNAGWKNPIDWKNELGCDNNILGLNTFPLRKDLDQSSVGLMFSIISRYISVSTNMSLEPMDRLIFMPYSVITTAHLQTYT